MELLNEVLKRNVRESLVYACIQLKSMTQIRMVIQEFYHSLNRKQILLNNEVESEIQEALKQLEDLAENWKFVM